MSWRDFWDRDTPIYVNERHKALHYQFVAAAIRRLIPSPEAVLLDYGCGEALSADQVAAKCARLYLCEAAPSVRDRVRTRFRSVPNIQVLAPEGGEQLPDHHLDLVFVNSVIQYLSFEELRSLLRLCREKLKPDGALVLADVVPPEVSAVNDARALLAFAWRGGFLLAAIAGLARTALSEYRKLRSEIGLAQYGEAEMIDLLALEGFGAERRTDNIGHNPERMTFVARPIEA